MYPEYREEFLGHFTRWCARLAGRRGLVQPKTNGKGSFRTLERGLIFRRATAMIAQTKFRAGSGLRKEPLALGGPKLRLLNVQVLGDPSVWFAKVIFTALNISAHRLPIYGLDHF